jgi:hypothetical protein
MLASFLKRPPGRRSVSAHFVLCDDDLASGNLTMRLSSFTKALAKATRTPRMHKSRVIDMVDELLLIFLDGFSFYVPMVD